MATSTHYVETRLWLASALEKTARWRDSKAAEFPNDQRNARAASALRTAAHYLRGVEASPGVQRIAELVHDCTASDIDLVGPNYQNGLPGSESERVAARYFFDHFAGAPDSESHEELVQDLYRALLRDLQSAPHSASSPLGRRLMRDEPPASEPTGGDLSEIRELLRDAQAERCVTRLVEIGRLLVELADTAAAEAAPDGRLPTTLQPTRMPLVRRQLQISLTALRSLGGQTLETASKLVLELPLFAAATISGVVSALEEVDRALESAVVRDDEPVGTGAP